MFIAAPPLAAGFRQLGLDSCAAISRHFLGNHRIAADEEVIVRPGRLEFGAAGAMDVFYKQYGYAPPIWKFIGRASKARCEYRNYERFAAIGLPSTTALACGEERDALGRLIRAFIVTRAIPDALPLPEFMDRHCADPGSPARQLAGVLRREMAASTRQMHAASFFHHDLVWRNILVNWRTSEEPALWWIDCPRGGFDHGSPWRERRRLKDLAALEKTSVLRWTPDERLEFFAAYLGHTAVTEEARDLAGKVDRYRRRRWPDSPDGPAATAASAGAPTAGR